MEIVFLIIGLAIGCIAAFLIAKFKYQNSGGTQIEDTTGLKTELSSLSNEKAKADERVLMMSTSNEELKKSLEAERASAQEFRTELSRTQAVNQNLEQKLLEQKSEVEKLQERFTTEFENLANKILDDKSRKFTEQNKDNINTILDPLKQKITDFEKRVNEIYSSDTKERASLAEQLRNLHELNKLMTEEASNLTKALKGDSKTQGNWGEFILETILEKSGLERGREFSIQETLTNEEGAKLRPDVIINLPENKSMIIDSKVSLNAYERYSSSESTEDKNAALGEHVNSIKRHLKGLSPKDYQNLYGLESLDFVLMFIPIEPAFALAVQHESNIFNEAFDKNIVIVSPSTLLATLRTIASIWKQEKQNKNAMEIARQSGALYDKFVSFVDDLVSIGKRIDSTKESYTEAMKKLYEGSGNLVRRVENIKQLGAKATKTLPQNLLDRSDEDSELKLIDKL